jgi:hypothetical protein
MEMTLEAFSLSNCLANYIRIHSEGDTTILFIRKCSFPDTSFVAMEISNGKIIQVRARFNTNPGDEVMKFVEEFAKAKGLVMGFEEAA